MPIYEYRCKKCGRLCEVFHRSSKEERSLTCSFCGHQELERQFSCFSAGSGAGKGVAGSTGSCKPSSGFH